MAKFNLGNYLNENVFKTDGMKQFTSTIGGVFSKGMNLFDGLTSIF